MHIFGLIQRIKNRSCYITNTLSDDPCYRCCRYRINKWLEGYKHTQTHAYKTECFDIRMLFKFDKTDYSTSYSASPHKTEQTPPPITLFTKSDKSQWRI